MNARRRALQASVAWVDLALQSVDAELAALPTAPPEAVSHLFDSGDGEPLLSADDASAGLRVVAQLPRPDGLGAPLAAAAACARARARLGVLREALARELARALVESQTERGASPAWADTPRCAELFARFDLLAPALRARVERAARSAAFLPLVPHAPSRVLLRAIR